MGPAWDPSHVRRPHTFSQSEIESKVRRYNYVTITHGGFCPPSSGFPPDERDAVPGLGVRHHRSPLWVARGPHPTGGAVHADLLRVERSKESTLGASAQPLHRWVSNNLWQAIIWCVQNSNEILLFENVQSRVYHRHITSSRIHPLQRNLWFPWSMTDLSFHIK